MPQEIVDPEAALIDTAVKEVLAGSTFRSSRQCQALLRYIVENTIAHRDKMLRERVIGANVFGRAPDYDTANDPVVRARAAELRKRLAQHYMEHHGHSETVRITVPSGSYKAVFELAEVRGLESTVSKAETDAVALGGSVDWGASKNPEEQKGETSRHDQHSTVEPVASAQKVGTTWWRSRVVATLVAIVILGLGTLAVRQIRAAHKGIFEDFWSPIVTAQRPALIFIGSNHLYRFKNDFLASYRSQHLLENTGREFFIDLKKGDKIDESELEPMDQTIGFGDVAAAARMASMLTRLNKRYDLRYGNDIAVTDLHSSPTILIGGFSNVWTLEVMHQVRFRLEGGDRIVDEKDKTRIWMRKSDEKTFSGDDYAVISRLVRSETGNFVVAIAGIDTYSNQAAADLLNDPDRLNALLKTLPKSWEQKNLQIVLHTSVVKDVPSALNLEAVEVW